MVKKTIFLVFQKVLFMWWSLSVFNFAGHTLTELFGKTDTWQEIQKQASMTCLHKTMFLSGVEEKKLLRS